MLLAVALFVPLFITEGLGVFDFWWWMASNAVIFISLSVADRGWRDALKRELEGQVWRNIALGLAAAALLYGVFFVGNGLSRLIFAFAGRGIQNVYDFKRGASVLRVALLIGLLIGPGEEIFWRGFLQRRLQVHLGPWQGFAVATALYAGIHVGSGNPMLILAALICGIFWGFLYMRTGSLLLVLVSHVVWDLTVFLLLPFH